MVSLVALQFADGQDQPEVAVVVGPSLAVQNPAITNRQRFGLIGLATFENLEALHGKLRQNVTVHGCSLFPSVEDTGSPQRESGRLGGLRHSPFHSISLVGYLPNPLCGEPGFPGPTREAHPPLVPQFTRLSDRVSPFFAYFNRPVPVFRLLLGDKSPSRSRVPRNQLHLVETAGGPRSVFGFSGSSLVVRAAPARTVYQVVTARDVLRPPVLAIMGRL